MIFCAYTQSSACHLSVFWHMVYQKHDVVSADWRHGPRLRSSATPTKIKIHGFGVSDTKVPMTNAHHERAWIIDSIWRNPLASGVLNWDIVTAYGAMAPIEILNVSSTPRPISMSPPRHTRHPCGLARAPEQQDQIKERICQ